MYKVTEQQAQAFINKEASEQAKRRAIWNNIKTAAIAKIAAQQPRQPKY